MLQGTIIRVAGPVVDVQFAAGKLPALQEALMPELDMPRHQDEKAEA